MICYILFSIVANAFYAWSQFLYDGYNMAVKKSIWPENSHSTSYSADLHIPPGLGCYAERCHHFSDLGQGPSKVEIFPKTLYSSPFKLCSFSK